MRGWDVFDTSRGLQIQRDDELNIYPDDEYAVLAAIAEAAAGDEYAREALICICFQDEERWEAYLAKRHQRHVDLSGRTARQSR